MLERGQFSDLVKMCKEVNQVHQREGQKAVKIILASATLSLPSQLNDKSLKLTDFDKRGSM